MSRVRITENFFLDEFTRSEIAARNGIEIRVDRNTAIFENLQRLCEEVLQPLRAALGPVHILSGYRPQRVNDLAKGSKTSAHLSGRAADIVVSGHTPLEVCEWLSRHCGFDELIHEFGQWTHVAIAPLGTTTHREVWTAVKVARMWRKPKTVYLAGLHDIETAYELAWEAA